MKIELSNAQRAIIAGQLRRGADNARARANHASDSTRAEWVDEVETMILLAAYIEQPPEPQKPAMVNTTRDLEQNGAGF